MFYAVTDLLTIATIWTWVESLQFNPFMSTQPNPWVDPTHVHVCTDLLNCVSSTTKNGNEHLTVVTTHCSDLLQSVVLSVKRVYSLQFTFIQRAETSSKDAIGGATRRQTLLVLVLAEIVSLDVTYNREVCCTDAARAVTHFKCVVQPQKKSNGADVVKCRDR